MAARVVFTYDLHGATSDVYKKLDELLAKKNYKKVLTDTTWEGDYSGTTTTVDGAVSGTKTAFAAAATEAGVKKYTLRIYAADPMKVTSVP